MTTAGITSVCLGLTRSEVSLGPGVHVLGRSSDCALALDDLQVSRHHAALEISAERVVVRDLDSRNGVRVNGERIDGPRSLRAGDLVVVGTQAIIVRRIHRATPVPSGQRAWPSGRAAPPGDEAVRHAMRAATTLSHSLLPGGQSLEAFRVLADAAASARAHGRPELAVHILEAPLVEALATVRAGITVDPEILVIVIEEATALREATGDRRWEDYVQDLYEKLGVPLPPDIAARLLAASDG
jgi:hypothetical protein